MKVLATSTLIMIVLATSSSAAEQNKKDPNVLAKKSEFEIALKKLSPTFDGQFVFSKTSSELSGGFQDLVCKKKGDWVECQ